MSRRSLVPPSFTETDQQAFLDGLYRRKRSAVADLDGAATLTDVINKINEILQADRASGQQDS